MGGTYDATGTMRWTMHVPLDEQLAFYRSHPPTALAGLTCTAVELPDYNFDGHGEPVNAIFEVTCRCEGALFDVFCWVDDGEVRSPIELWCEACEDAYTIYDCNEHGYDAVAGGLPRDEPGPEGYDVDLESDDVPAPHRVIVRFEFPSDHLGSGRYDGKEPELFSWITILAQDPTTRRVAYLFDEECA